jgi:hypothetical protein
MKHLKKIFANSFSSNHTDRIASPGARKPEAQVKPFPNRNNLRFPVLSGVTHTFRALQSSLGLWNFLEMLVARCWLG